MRPSFFSQQDIPTQSDAGSDREPASGDTESGISANMLVQSRDQTTFVHETKAECDQQNKQRSSFSQFQFNLI